MANQLLIDVLNKLYNQYKLSNDITVSQFKANVISKLIKIIKSYNKEIIKGEDLKDIKGVGKGSVYRINEILKTSSLKELNKTDKYTILGELEKVTGIGKVRAKSLVIDHNVSSVNDLKQKVKDNKIEVTHHIQVGLKYYDDINKKIPRNEIDNIYKLLLDIVKTIDSKLVLTICGSYRRELKTSGDIDILISHPQYKVNIYENKYLQQLVNILIEKKFILDNLTTNGKTKYMGICKIANIARRIDIRCVNYNSYYTALLYFTGSQQLNILMRQHALENDYKLNEYLVYNLKTKKEIYPKSEEEIFKLCKMDYIKPYNRNL
jgi:DNA polymerase beta